MRPLRSPNEGSRCSSTVKSLFLEPSGVRLTMRENRVVYRGAALIRTLPHAEFPDGVIAGSLRAYVPWLRRWLGGHPIHASIQKR